MNVLIYAIDFAPKIGGEETYLLLLGAGLARRLASSGKETGPSRVAEGMVTLVTRTPAGTFDDSRVPFRVIRRPSLPVLWRLFGAADVVQVSGPVLLALLLGLLRRKPIVISHHTYHAACPNGLLLFRPSAALCPGHFQAGRYQKCLRCCARDRSSLQSLLMVLTTILRRWLCTRATVNVTVTHYVAERLGLPHSTTVYYGVPDLPDRPRTTTVVHQPVGDRRRSPVCFAYVGRLVPEKGVELLLQAAKHLHDDGCEFRLKLIGDGPERLPLESLVRTLNLEGHVVFTGFLRDDVLHAELANVDVVVMPSLCPETAGLAAIEQMMRGRLVVAADIGGLGEVVGEAGFKFAAGDPMALTECLRRVLEDSSRASRLGVTARERALEFFGEDRMMEEHFQIYRRVAHADGINRG